MGTEMNAYITWFGETEPVWLTSHSHLIVHTDWCEKSAFWLMGPGPCPLWHNRYKHIIVLSERGVGLC